MVQFIVGSFFLILRRLNQISAAPIIRSSQRRSLFSLFWTFETSALADLGYHINMFLMADDVKGCSGVFDHNQLRYSLLKFPRDVAFLMPAWAILFVFRIASKSNGYADHSTEASSLASVADIVVVRNWQRRYRPLNQPSQHDQPVLSGRRPRTSNLLREVSSASSTISGRSLSASRSLVSSPLYSIPEETVSHERDTVAVFGSIDRLSMVPLAND